MLIVALPSPLCAEERAEKTTRLRVLSYNIHHGEGSDGQLNLARIAGVIESVQPDLVALQEVDRNAERSGGVDQPTELARLTGMQVVFGGNIPLQGGEYGNAVLSRRKIVRSQNHQLPRFNNGEQRGVLEVEVALPTGAGSLTLLATHLDHRRDDSERLASVGTINQRILTGSGPPALLVGDLNDVPGSATLQQLQTVWAVSNDDFCPTIPVGKPQRQIDYILYTPAARWVVQETRVLPEAEASDHRPIFCVLELLSPEQQP